MEDSLKPLVDELRRLFDLYIKQLESSRHYESVPNDRMEMRSISTQTDPLSDEEEYLLFGEEDEEEEDLYEELDDEPNGETMERLLYLDQPVDYEEVELQRSASCRRLGLTLCYGGENENDADIFVSDIEGGSAAERCGRVQIGDQILQINGTNVRSREEAMNQFGRESEKITLLLARPSDEREEDEEEQIIVESGFGNKNLGTVLENEDSTENSQCHEKDSGLSRTTDSEPENAQKKSLSAETQKTRSSMERTFEKELAQLHSEMENIRLECAKLMEKRSEANEQSSRQTQQSASSLMAMIEKLSEPIGRQSKATEAKSISQLPTPRSLRRSKAQLSAFQPFQPRSPHNFRFHDESSSAYNTGGDSCRSTPNKAEFPPVNPHTLVMPPRRPIHLTMTKKKADSTQLSPTTSEHPYHTIETPTIVPTPTVFRLPRFHDSTEGKETPILRSQCRIQPPPSQPPKMTFRPGDIMYTSPDKLAETIALQQRLLRQTFTEQNTHRATTSQFSTTNEYHMVREKPQSSYEWKVKRRADGTRYITRCPLRSQVLKAREEQLNRERTGLSTDDDAASELKTGKFWTRSERKQHLERQREKKQRKHQILSQKQKFAQNEQIIQELSHRKQMRRSGQQFFDKFTTIQEFLCNGARDPALRPVGGILSVTTV